MSDKSAISWTDVTWNPLLGCSRVSAGCARCYAINHVHRMAGNPNPKIRAANEGLTTRHGNGQLDWTGAVRTLPSRLEQPLHWRTPRRVFVNSLSDLFHPEVPFLFVAAVFGVIANQRGDVWRDMLDRVEHERDAARLDASDLRWRLYEATRRPLWGRVARWLRGKRV